MFKLLRRQYHPLLRVTGLACRNLSTPSYHTLLHSSRAGVSNLPRPLQWRSQAAAFVRRQSTGSAGGPGEKQTGSQRGKDPAYEITFTCRPCQERSAHRISKQGYHHGSVLITCPGCKSRHIISDHLNVGVSQAYSQDLSDLARCLETAKLTSRRS